MEDQQSGARRFVLPFILILVVILLITILVLLTMRQLFITPSPAGITPNPTINRSNLSISPTAAREYTGAVPEEPKEEEIAASREEITLLNKLPLDTPQFTISMDYRNQKYIVSLKTPKDENKNYFDKWRLENYPLISPDQFIIR